jgi:hypothetical protein
MQSVNEPAAAFLANKRVAAPASPGAPKTHGSNSVYRRLSGRVATVRVSVVSRAAWRRLSA